MYHLKMDGCFYAVHTWHQRSKSIIYGCWPVCLIHPYSSYFSRSYPNSSIFSCLPRFFVFILYQYSPIFASSLSFPPNYLLPYLFALSFLGFSFLTLALITPFPITLIRSFPTSNSPLPYLQFAPFPASNSLSSHSSPFYLHSFLPHFFSTVVVCC